MSIIIKDLDETLINFCDLEADYKNIILVNKYYQKIISMNKLFSELAKVKKNMEPQSQLLVCSYKMNCVLLVKYLVEKYKIDMHSYIYSVFKHSCKNGHIEMLKYLIDASTEKLIYININVNDNYAFRHSCKNGHLEITKYLIEISQYLPYKKINIHACNDYAFRYSCYYNHLEIAKYLIKLSLQSPYQKIDIGYNNNDVFIAACLNGDVAIVKYLIKLSKLKMNSDQTTYWQLNIDQINRCNSSIRWHCDVKKYFIELSKKEPEFYDILPFEVKYIKIILSTSILASLITVLLAYNYPKYWPFAIAFTISLVIMILLMANIIN